MKNDEVLTDLWSSFEVWYDYEFFTTTFRPLHVLFSKWSLLKEVGDCLTELASV